MAIAVNPKKLAQDIAECFMSLSASGLKKSTPADLEIILTNLSEVQRESRAIQMPC